MALFLWSYASWLLRKANLNFLLSKNTGACHTNQSLYPCLQMFSMCVCFTVQYLYIWSLFTLQHFRCCCISLKGITQLPKHTMDLVHESFYRWIRKSKRNGFCNHSHWLGHWFTSEELPAQRYWFCVTRTHNGIEMHHKASIDSGMETIQTNKQKNKKERRSNKNADHWAEHVWMSVILISEKSGQVQRYFAKVCSW